MNFKNFTLDPFQEEAIQAIEKNCSVVVSAPTGSGKTLIADYIIEKHKDDPQRIIYTAPIKALSNQKYRDFVKEYGEDKVGLMTGDIVINPRAKVLIMITEIYRNMAVCEDPELRDVAYVIFDEIHFINDPERGYVWEESIIYSSEKARFLCLSATIPNAAQFSNWIQSIKKHPVKIVMASKRNVPLRQFFYDYEQGMLATDKLEGLAQSSEFRRRPKQQVGRRGKKEKFPAPSHLEAIKDLFPDKLPCFYFVFSRRDCQEKARELARLNLFPKDTRTLQFFNSKLAKAPSDINQLLSTRMLKETIPQGIAFHHAGLLPVIKEAVEELFAQGLIKVLYVTETFAVGINMPAKTVCFDSLRKFDGYGFRNLNSKEFFQIAGRAGRRGIDAEGYVVVMIYRPTFRWEEVHAITSRDVEPIRSQFKLGVNTVLNLIHLHPPKEIEKILRLSFYSYQKFGEKYRDIPTIVLLSRYYAIVRRLKKFEYIDQEGKLTEKGVFSSKVYADEITLGEVFATPFVEQLDEEQVLFVLAALVYEEREKEKFKVKPSWGEGKLAQLKSLLQRHPYLVQEKKFNVLPAMTIFIRPILEGQSFFDVLKEAEMVEGDLIRIYAQILDRIGQIKKATASYTVRNKMENCQGIVQKALEGVYGV